ncbi:hypothetical protein LCGC14_2014860, partial [marine sediment metagenome]
SAVGGSPILAPHAPVQPAFGFGLGWEGITTAAAAPDQEWAGSQVQQPGPQTIREIVAYSKVPRLGSPLPLFV